MYFMIKIKIKNILLIIFESQTYPLIIGFVVDKSNNVIVIKIEDGVRFY